MKIIIDEREKQLYDECCSMITSQTTPSYSVLSTEVLPVGDILIKTDQDENVLCIERKSFSDLLASIKDGRYEEQSYRLAHSSGFPLHSIVYILEGVFSQLRSTQEKKIIYSAMTSLQYFKGFSVYKTSSVRETAEWLLNTAEKIEKNFSKGKVPYYLTNAYQEMFLKNTMKEGDKPDNYCSVVKKTKKENITKENIGEIILCQIPGISSTTAIAIMKPYDNFYEFMDTVKNDSSCLENLFYESNGKQRKINKTCILNIKKYLFNQEYTA